MAAPTTTATAPPARAVPVAAVVATLCLCGTVVALQQTLVVPLLPDFPEILGTSTDNASWLVTSTLLVGAVVSAKQESPRERSLTGCIDRNPRRSRRRGRQIITVVDPQARWARSRQVPIIAAQSNTIDVETDVGGVVMRDDGFEVPRGG